jgi:hypothetical protein
MTASQIGDTQHRAALSAPYSIAMFFVLTLVAASGGEVVRVSDLWLPLAIMLALALTAHVAASLATGSLSKGALIAWVIVVAFGAFGNIAGNPDDTPATMTRTELPSLAGCATVVGCLVVAIVRSRRDLGGILHYLAVVGALVLAWSGWSSARSLRAGAPTTAVLAPSHIVAPPFSGRPPDVLLLILDKYTASHTLAEQFDFENTDFAAFLRSHGFLVPSRPRANYVQTFLALSAFLNLEYLHPTLDSKVDVSASRQRIYDAVEGNRLAAFLKERGYRFVFTPTAYGATRRNRFADLQLPDPLAIRSEFVTVWYTTTPLPALRWLACAVVTCAVDTPYVPEAAAMLDWKFERLAELPGHAQPVFALVHLTLPHEPYIYLRDCRHRAPFWPIQDDGRDSAEIRQAYTAQIQCLNHKLETLITAWQAHSRMPVILLQADHGHGRMGRHLPELPAVSPALLADRTSVFAAYDIPGADASALPDSVTPVNAMRFFLRTTFRAELPPLADATYWSSSDRPYHMARVP